MKNPFERPLKEKVSEIALRDGFKVRGGIAFKFVSPGRRSVPDRICLLPVPLEHQEIVSRYVRFVEMKREGKGATDAQARELQRLQDMGFDARVVSGQQEVKEYFEELDL